MSIMSSNVQFKIDLLKEKIFELENDKIDLISEIDKSKIILKKIKESV